MAIASQFFFKRNFLFLILEFYNRLYRLFNFLLVIIDLRLAILTTIVLTMSKELANTLLFINNIIVEILAKTSAKHIEDDYSRD